MTPTGTRQNRTAAQALCPPTTWKCSRTSALLGEELLLLLLRHWRWAAVLTHLLPPLRSWFHGKISRMQAESVLMGVAQEGAFLFRESESSPGASEREGC